VPPVFHCLDVSARSARTWAATTPLVAGERLATRFLRRSGCSATAPLPCPRWRSAWLRAGPCGLLDSVPAPSARRDFGACASAPVGQSTAAVPACLVRDAMAVGPAAADASARPRPRPLGGRPFAAAGLAAFASDADPRCHDLVLAGSCFHGPAESGLVLLATTLSLSRSCLLRPCCSCFSRPWVWAGSACRDPVAGQLLLTCWPFCPFCSSWPCRCWGCLRRRCWLVVRLLRLARAFPSSAELPEPRRGRARGCRRGVRARRRDGCSCCTRADGWMVVLRLHASSLGAENFDC